MADRKITANEVLEAAEQRRSIYSIGSETSLADDKILEIIRRAAITSPTAFNSQSHRVVVLLGDAHEKLWNMTEEILRGVVPAEAFEQTHQKVASFRAGRGTLLFFEEQATVRGLQEKFPLYKDNFPLWSLQSSGMLQVLIWTALEAEGLGVSLQHYNPLIDAKVREAWNIPESWLLLGEMPFGSKLAPAKAKESLSAEELLKVYR